MTRSDFKKTAVKVLVMGRALASLTPTDKDDMAVELFAGLIEDPDKFAQVCDLIGLPLDAPTTLPA
jgi:hypothetical protein